MADDLLIAFDNFDNFFPTSERNLLPVANPFDAYDEKKFRERFRLSKTVVKCLLDEVSEKLHLFYETHYVSFIISSTTIQAHGACTALRPLGCGGVASATIHSDLAGSECIGTGNICLQTVGVAQAAWHSI